MAERRENEREGQGEQRREGQGGQSSGSKDLKEREYRDKEGNIHHHTRTSREMQEGGEKERK